MSQRAWIVLGVIAVALLAIGGPMLAIASDTATPEQRVPPLDAASASVQRFMDTYVQPDGRVARPENGGDTTADLQAAGLLIAVANSDHARFASMWAWTQANLRKNGMLLAGWTPAGPSAERSDAG